MPGHSRNRYRRSTTSSIARPPLFGFDLGASDLYQAPIRLTSLCSGSTPNIPVCLSTVRDDDSTAPASARWRASFSHDAPRTLDHVSSRPSW